MNIRLANSLGALACAGLMAYALYVQHGLGLEPCPLCILQRLAVIGLGGIFLVAALHPAGATGRRVYGILLALVALAGSGVAGRHVWLTTLPP
ncbi:MAG: disulfide bond formation protein B, partial [Gammaproteobacteria bacterium]|nr:disulfide bond formation protein B [Gammaproteobacteria bacterium]